MAGRNPSSPVTPAPPAGEPKTVLDTPEQTLQALQTLQCLVYRWDLTANTVHWSANSGEALGPALLEQLGRGTTFRAFLGCTDESTDYHRFARALPLASMPYEALVRPAIDGTPAAFRVHDQGRWRAGSDGQPEQAVGTLEILPLLAPVIPGGTADPLTGALTRRHLTEALGTLPFGPQARWALLLVGLDDLGRINDRFGFETADRLLVALAGRLRQQLSSADLLLRFSGNKFAILLTETSVEALGAFGERLISEIREARLSAGEGQLPVSVTIGAVLPPHQGEAPDAIIARLQEAHEMAKRRGRGRFFLDLQGTRNEGRRRANLQMADEIVQAIDRNDVTVAYQPVVRATTRTLVFCEALARIAHDRYSRQYSGHRLVAAADSLGLMGHLDRSMLKQVAADMRRDPTLHVSINVSASSIMDEAWIALYRREVDTDIGRRLIVELTESVAVDHLSAARNFIAQVRPSGARIAIDDFGAGATSFRNLRKLGVDLVKIDGGYIINMAKSPDDQAFVRALLTLSRQLGIETVAEWVQNEIVAAQLLEWGCDYLQGSLSGLARPLTTEHGT